MKFVSLGEMLTKFTQYEGIGNKHGLGGSNFSFQYLVFARGICFFATK